MKGLEILTRRRTTAASAACALLSATLLLSSAPLRADELVLDPRADAGDAPAEFERLLALLRAEPADPRVPLVLGGLGSRRALVAAPDAALRAALQAALPQAGWNQDAILQALAGLEAAAGNHAEARALRARRGMLQSFLVCGPFGLAPTASLTRPFPPELAANRKAIAPGERFRGLRGAELPWHELSSPEPGRAVSPGAKLEGVGAVAYALTHLRSPAEAAQEAWLVYYGPSARVWINRELVAEVDRSAARLPQRIRFPIQLRPGWNRVLIKVTGGAQARFVAQVCEPTGAPLVLEESLVQEVAPGRGGLATLHPRAALETLAAAKEPQRRALYAWTLANEGLSEEALGALEALATQSSQSSESSELAGQAWYQLLLGRLVAEAGHLPASVRRNRAREAFEAALRLEPQARHAALRLADFEFADDKTLPAIARLETLLKATPADLEVRLRLFAALLGQGWSRPAEDLLEATPAAQRSWNAVLRARVQLLRAQGRSEEIPPLLEQIYAQDASQLDALEARVEAAKARADRAGAQAAQAALDLARQADPAQVAVGARAIALAFGDRSADLAAVRAWAAVEPESELRRLALADRLTQDSEQDPEAKAEALKLLEGILSESPGNQGARRLWEGLSGQEDRFWERWEPDIDQVLADAPQASTWPQANRVCLFDQMITKIYPDTSSVDVVHQVWRMLDEGAKQALGERPQSGETLLIRTISAEGEVLEPIAPKEGQYQLPGLRPGAAVEHAFRLRRAPATFQFESGPFYFMDPQLEEPFWLSRWVILVHRDAPVEIVERNLDRPGIKHSVSEEGEWKVHVFEARHQPRVEPEPQAPGRDELLPWIRVIERKRLDEFDGLYRERALRGRAPAPSVSAKAEEVLLAAGRAQQLEGPLAGDEARADALLEFVHEHVTTPGENDDPAQILASRSGSKSSLYRALLRAAGVPHQLAFAGASPHALTRTDWSLPELGQFGLPLVRIEPREGSAYYLLPDAARLGPRRRLPPSLWGAPVYVCAEEGGFLDVLPEGKLEEESVRTRVLLTLDEQGGAKVVWRQELRGFNYFAAKERLAAAQEFQLRGYFARQLNELYPGARLERFALPGLEEQGVPTRWKLEGEVPQLLRQRQDGSLWLGGLISPTQVAAQYGSHRVRRFPLAFDDPVVVEDSSEVVLGPYACPHLPQELRINERLLQYSLRATRPSPDRVRLERRLLIRPGRISPEDYAHFREQLRRIDEAEQAGLGLERRAAGEGEGGGK